MQLDTRDSRILEGFVVKEKRIKRILPIIFAGDVVGATVVYFAKDAPWALWVALALVAVGAMSVFILAKFMTRGEGSAESILAGREPTRTGWATVLDDKGDQPNPWSLRLDEAIGLDQYVQLGVDGTEWSPSTGERYRIAGFGGERTPFRGVVLVTGESSPARHWLYSVVLSSEPHYVHTSE